MFPFTNDKKGYTLIEMFLVLMILLVFSITAFSLIFYGSDTYNKLIADKNNEADARILLTTYETRLRQYDYVGGYELKTIECQNQPLTVLAMKEYADDGTPVNTWLFWQNGKLFESLTVNNELPTPDTSQELFRNQNLDLKIEGNDQALTIRVAYPFSGGTREISTIISRRAGK